MKLAHRAVVAVALLGCLAGLVWMFDTGHHPSNMLVGKSNVVGGIAGVLALALAVVLLWPRTVAGQAPVSRSSSQIQDAVEYLAAETLRYWQDQAKARRITAPSPASVRWTWASEDVAVPADRLQPALLTAGVVTRLREQLYARMGQPARMVLLGRPGAGKTAAMLLLLIDILKHRPPRSSEPVPVWLTLGGWNPDTTPLQVWAAARLTRDYPGLAAADYGGPGAAADLIRDRRIALFLDGLDEMPPDLQGRALETIDREGVGLHLVLTSRPTAYAAAVEQGRLWGAAVIDVLPVDLDHAAKFLLSEQLGERRRAWQQVVNHMRAHPDSVPARSLTTPLALSLARDTYTRADLADLLDTRAHPTPEVLLQHLLTQSLALAYPDSDEREHATRWLSWIAHRMGTSRDLCWWDIPAWAPQWQKRLGAGLLVGLGGGLAVGLVVGPAGGLMFGLIFGLIVGSVFGLERKPHELGMRSPNGRELRHLLVVGLRGGLGAGLIVGSMAGLARGLVAGLAAGLAIGPAGGLMDLWYRPSATARATSPLEVYRSDLRLTLVVGLVGGLASGLAAGLAAGLVLGLGLVGGLAVVLAFVLAFGLAVGLGGGRGPAIQLAVVELLWRLRGQRVRFVPLLQTALNRQVLRQAGAIYQFRHAALQDLLATTQTAIEPAIVETDTVPESVITRTPHDQEQTPSSGSPEN